MEAKRLTTGLLAFPFVLIILLIGNKYIVDIVFAIVAAISLHEYFNAFKLKAKPIIWIRLFSVCTYCFCTFYTISICTKYYCNHYTNSCCSSIFNSYFYKYEIYN